MPSRPAPPSPPSVQVMQVRYAASDPVSFVGIYTTARSIPLAPTQAGRLRSISVHPGQQVHAGDVLARFEDRLLLQILDQAQGNVDAARAEARQASDASRRSRGLDSVGGLSTGAVAGRSFAAQAAQGRYRAALHQAQIPLERFHFNLVHTQRL